MKEKKFRVWSKLEGIIFFEINNDHRDIDVSTYTSGQWIPTWYMNDEWEVKHVYNTQQFIVDLGKRTCKCIFGIWLVFPADMLVQQ